MPLPENTDEQKLADVALALLWLGCHGEKNTPRVWKSMDWDVMNLLHERGLISNPVGKAKSVHLAPEALIKGEALFKKHFASSGPE